MNDFFARVRFKVLTIRILMGIVFGFMLTRFFFPGASIPFTLLICGLLVFFAYGFEWIHKGRN